MSNIPVFDEADAMRRLAGNKAILKRLFDKFLTQDILAPIREALGNPEAMAAAAHTLKGMSANLSLEQLRQEAYALEINARQGGVPDVLPPSLTAAVEESCEFVRNYIASL